MRFWSATWLEFDCNKEALLDWGSRPLADFNAFQNYTQFTVMKISYFTQHANMMNFGNKIDECVYLLYWHSLYVIDSKNLHIWLHDSTKSSIPLNQKQKLCTACYFPSSCLLWWPTATTTPTAIITIKYTPHTFSPLRNHANLYPAHTDSTSFGELLD